MIERHVSLSSSSDPSSVPRLSALRRFWSHLYGLESFGGRKVLEIGGTDEISLESYFAERGSDYTNVRLEGKRSRRVRVGDFMDVQGEYDLVISLGVFEPGALDIDRESMIAGPIRHAQGEIAQKLSSLTAPGGFCVIGTILSPCSLGDGMLRSCGFRVLSRRSPFYTFMNAGNKGLYAEGDRSELLLLFKLPAGGLWLRQAKLRPA